MANNWPSGETADPSRLTNGYIGHTMVTGATSATTTEIMHVTVTVALNTGRRYEVTNPGGQVQSSALGDRIVIRYRISAVGGSVSTSSTQLAITAGDAARAATNVPVNLEALVTVAAAGTYQIGMSLIRTTGGGTGKLDYSPGVIEPYLLVKDIGAV